MKSERDLGHRRTVNFFLDNNRKFTNLFPVAIIEDLTRPNPVGHGYVFSMAVGTIWEWLKLAPFLLGDEQLILKGGGGWKFFKINILAVKHLKINILT